ncbi:MAG: hypothetical protein NTU81_00360 [Candidatus Nomurabacteria bacterium]|nr:hypothetical protein [Candidatus Nomurabacteria bacterium]
METEEIKNQTTIDVEALKKELEGFIADVKKEKEKIEALSAGVITKSEEIELYHTNFIEIRTKLSDGSTGMEALFNQSTNLKNKIDQVNTNAQTELNQITEKANAINIKIQELETYYGTFTDLKSKLNDGQTGLQALLDQATALKNSINQIEVDSQTALEKVNATVLSITEKVVEIETYYTTNFLPLKTKVDDPKIGIQATLNIATDLKSEIIKTKTSVDQRFIEIKTLSEKSGELKQSAESSVKEIEGMKAKSLEFKESIGETLDLVTASSLTDSFVKRRDTIYKNARFWKYATLGSVILLGASVLYIYYLQNKAVDGFKDFHAWYRYLFTSPLIYLVYLCSHNYNMERDYEERYAFKTVLSTSLQAYIKLLSDKFSDKKDELLQFTLASIERIYKEPYEDKDRTQEIYGGVKSWFNFGAKNHVIKSQTTQQTPEQTKSVTE